MLAYGPLFQLGSRPWIRGHEGCWYGRWVLESGPEGDKGAKGSQDSRKPDGLGPLGILSLSLHLSLSQHLVLHLSTCHSLSLRPPVSFPFCSCPHLHVSTSLIFSRLWGPRLSPRPEAVEIGGVPGAGHPSRPAGGAA